VPLKKVAQDLLTIAERGIRIKEERKEKENKKKKDVSIPFFLYSISFFPFPDSVCHFFNCHIP